MQRRYLQLDVFSERAGSGNALGVVVDAEGLDAAAMQAIARWLNLSETVFFQPTDPGADYHVRIFTPTCELPFAGHPSVGAAWAAVHLELASPSEERLLTQQCAAGLLPVRITGSRWFRQVQVRCPQAQQRADVQAQLPPQLAAIALPGSVPVLWNNGPDWWLLPVQSEAQLRSYRPELEAITALPQSGKLALFAAADRPDVGYQYVVRAFAPGAGVNEDPVTGSANALIAAHLQASGQVSAGQHYQVSQGRECGRNGQLQVQLDLDGGIWVGGSVQPVIEGHIHW